MNKQPLINGGERALASGLTLLETLVALVLLVAAGAIVLPLMVNRLDEQAFDSAADVTNEQLLLARARAQSTGSPVEVTYNRATSQVLVRFFGVAEQTAVRSPFPGMEDADVRPNTYVERLPASAAGEIAESWACHTLESTIRLSAARPGAASASGELGEARAEPDLDEEDYESLEDLVSGQEVRLAVFMPDGSAVVGEPVWLEDDGGRKGMFIINPWSGLPMFKRVDADPGVEGHASRAGGDIAGSSPMADDFDAGVASSADPMTDESLARPRP